MDSGLVLVTCQQMQEELPKHIDRIEALGYRVHAPALNGRQHFLASELATYGTDLVGIIAGDDQLNQDFFDSASQLRALVRWGIGIDSVDQNAAAEKGITVRNTPGVFGNEVADQAFAYILNLARGQILVDRDVRAGLWPKFEGTTLSGSTIGIIGFGSIGREIATRATAFGMKSVVFDPLLTICPPGIELVNLEQLLSNSRFVVLACPLTAATYHLLDSTTLAKMSADAFLINVARGPIVDESALFDALQSGRIAGAALDVYESEPLHPNSPLRSLNNVVLGAHNASNTREGVIRASAAAVDALLEELARNE